LFPSTGVLCDGQALPIRQYAALYAILGVQYGGNGVNNFKLPDLRGRTLLGAQGQPPLTNHSQGSVGGTEAVDVTSTGVTAALSQANMPSHTYTATMSMSDLSAATAIKVSTGNGGQLFAAEGSTLSSTQGGASGAAIYQPSNVPQQAPVTLGGVTTTVTGTGSITVDKAGTDTPVGVAIAVSAKVPTVMPFLAMNYIICVNGLYPQRN